MDGDITWASMMIFKIERSEQIWSQENQLMGWIWKEGEREESRVTPRFLA